MAQWLEKTGYPPKLSFLRSQVQFPEPTWQLTKSVTPVMEE